MATLNSRTAHARCLKRINKGVSVDVDGTVYQDLFRHTGMSLANNRYPGCIEAGRDKKARRKKCMDGFYCG